jgi:ChaC-like protein
MKRFVEGVDRGQSTLFPECLDDWIGEENPVRVIDVFVDELDLGELGFSGVDPETTGRPSYHPAVVVDRQSPHYAARLSPDDVADVLATAAGHLGSGAEYLRQTVSRLEALGIRDRNLWRLQALVAARIGGRG